MLAFKGVVRRLHTAYGYVADLSKSRSHNTSLQLARHSMIFLHCPSKMACHNLCSNLTPPKVRALLGLGLNFCPQPTQWVQRTVVDDLVKRSKRDIYTKMFSTHIESEWTPNQLFLRSSWEPNAPQSSTRISSTGRLLFASSPRTIYPTASEDESHALPRNTTSTSLKALDDFIVFPKNLGPVILDRTEYVG